jgi:ATP-dependent Lon protease
VKGVPIYEREAEEVPPEARKEMEFHFVDTAEEVLALALVPPGKGGCSSQLSRPE